MEPAFDFCFTCSFMHGNTCNNIQAAACTRHVLQVELSQGWRHDVFLCAVPQDLHRVRAEFRHRSAGDRRVEGKVATVRGSAAGAAGTHARGQLTAIAVLILRVQSTFYDL